MDIASLEKDVEIYKKYTLKILTRPRSYSSYPEMIRELTYTNVTYSIVTLTYQS